MSMKTRVRMRNKPFSGSEPLKKVKSQTLQDILESDEELPNEYIELPFIPAYQRDNRFEHIEKDNEEKKAIIQKKEGLTKCEIDVARGYLNKKDTFCFKCIEPNTPKKTQQWFFNFLMMKDLNASYTFLSTCLVPSFDKLLQNRNEL